MNDRNEMLLTALQDWIYMSAKAMCSSAPKLVELEESMSRNTPGRVRVASWAGSLFESAVVRVVLSIVRYPTAQYRFLSTGVFKAITDLGSQCG